MHKLSGGILMHTNERFDKILDHLKLHKRASVADLSRLLYVSEATVRRDLNDMQRMGLLKRTHGGAVYADGSEEVSIFVRQEVNAPWKEATAAIALPHLPDFRTVFIDNSSTCLALVERMNLQHKMVVTNGFQAALFLSQKDDVQVIMPGGLFKPNTGFTGSMACKTLRGFRFDVMFSSCAAADLEGTYENSLSVKELKATAMELSQRHVLVLDRSKFQLRSPYRTAPLRKYDYIFTDADDATLRPYREAGIRIINK